MRSFNKVILKSSASLKEVINTLQSADIKIVCVINEDNQLIGTVTDGDVRRAFLKNCDSETSVKKFMNPKPVTVSLNTTKIESKGLMKKYGIHYLPVVDDNNKLLGIETLSEGPEESKFINFVFILAGGFGTRLYPLTKDTPKPMLKIGDRPILERIILQLIDQGFENYIISTHYKGDQIKNYFGDGSNLDINIKYVEEEIPLGTAGSLGLIEKNITNLPILVINADLVTDIDFRSLLNFHQKHNVKATICVKDYEYQVPYGVIESTGVYLNKIEEKPVKSFKINAGIYVVDPALYEDLSGKEFMNMPVLIVENLSNEEVAVFPVHEYWLDVGRIDDFDKANNHYLGKN